MGAGQVPTIAPLAAGEGLAFAGREAGSPGAASFEGGGAALGALALILFIAALTTIVLYYLVEDVPA